MKVTVPNQGEASRTRIFFERRLFGEQLILKHHEQRDVYPFFSLFLKTTLLNRKKKFYFE